jgi:hypothetical protein
VASITVICTRTAMAIALATVAVAGVFVGVHDIQPE